MSDWKKVSEDCWSFCILPMIPPAHGRGETNFTVNSTTPISKVLMSVKQRFGLGNARLISDGSVITDESIPIIYLEGCRLVLEPLNQN